MDLNQILNTKRLSEMREALDHVSTPRERRAVEKAISRIEAHWSNARNEKVAGLKATRDKNQASVVETAKAGRQNAKEMLDLLTSGHMSAKDATAKLRDAHGEFRQSVEQYEAIRSNEADLEEWQSKSVDEYQESQFQHWPQLMHNAPTFGSVLNEVASPHATVSPLMMPGVPQRPDTE